MPFIKMKWITREFVREHPDWVFVFGDNEERVGLGGQAKAMRGEPNAIGVATKKAAGHRPQDYWYDSDYNRQIDVVTKDFIPVMKALVQERTVVFPKDGIGTGLAKLKENAPNTLQYIELFVRILEQYSASTSGGLENVEYFVRTDFRGE